MRNKKLLLILSMVLMISTFFTGCIDENSNHKDKKAQEELMQQANDMVGMPNITDFYEKKLAKKIFELRDDSKLICHAYTRNEMTGKYIYLGKSMGYGLPYSTQYTNPEVYEYNGATLPQADPNGLFSPEGLSATWLILIDEETGKENIMYAEPEIMVTQSKLPRRLCDESSLPSDY